MTKIKICGLTNEREIAALNEEQVDYAGFVFYQKSKRNICLEKANALKRGLLPSIKTVAVTVSPDLALVGQITEAGFDVIQIHGELHPNTKAQIMLPIWQAVNISSAAEAAEALADLQQQPNNERVTGYVIDGAQYGSGTSFRWERFPRELLKGRSFLLAGGLKEANVEEAIRIFSPDVVDVSSGVEGENGKEPKKIKAFVRKVREHG